MKYLTIIRHGKAKTQKPQESDSDRSLKKEGVSASYRLGELLAERECLPDVVFTSEAVRARETAENLCKALGVGKEKIIAEPVFYNSDIGSILAFLKGLPDSYGHVFFVGHNPTFTELVNTLCGPVIDNMKTAGAACVEFRPGSWQEIIPGEASLKFYVAV